MTNAIPKIYNEQTNEWIELMAKPIAKEVVEIMNCLLYTSPSPRDS